GNAPQGSVPLLVNGTKGGLSACTNASPGSAATGLVNIKRDELIIVSGIFCVPVGPKPPRLATPVLVLAEKLITVAVEKPAPLTVSVFPLCVTLFTMIRAPIGTDTAALFSV